MEQVQVQAGGSAAVQAAVRTRSGSAGRSSARATRRAQSVKRFECTHPGCSKRFTRMEHMQRHALNHTAGDSTCPRCSAHFKRPDLLERHMNRHQQRDLEAGGPGYGILDTRKRAWRETDGSVVEKRPRIDPSLTGASSSLPFEPSGQVVSPPVSDEGRYSHGYQPGVDNGDEAAICIDAVEAFPAAPQPTSATPSVPYRRPDAYPHPTTSLRSRPQPSFRHDQLAYQPTFQPDTASSFNMPYTTALDYNWLFNLESATASGFGLLSSGYALQDQGSLQGQPGQVPEQRHGHETVELIQESGGMAPGQQVQSHTPRSQNSGSWRSLADLAELAEDSLHQSPRRETPSAFAASSQWNATETRPRQPAQTRVTTEPRTNNVHVRRNKRGREDDVRTGDPPGQHRDGSSRGLVHDEAGGAPSLEQPLSMLHRPDSLPQIDRDTRERLLGVVEMANPQIPDRPAGSSIRDHPSLSLASLQSWLDLFFTHFNATYPLMHMSTFDPTRAEPLLLLSALLLGATYSDKSAHQTAVCIHDVIRPSIFAHGGFSPSPELWALQTILLVECFGKSRAGQKQHDVSHLFHGLLINLIRRSDCQSVAEVPPRPPPPPPAPEAGGDAAGLDGAWRRWAEAEQKKRLALLCFMWDTQHAVLFCQSLCMSAFELRCALPCSQGAWEAADAGRWAAARGGGSSSSAPAAAEPMFLPALRSYLAPSASGPPGAAGGDLDALGLVLVLHGIMSIAWDMQRRDQTSLGVGSTAPGGYSSWRELVGRAYDRWKVDFDRYCGDAAAAAAAAGAARRAEWLSFGSAYRTVYHAAQALLHVEFLDVQIYAGARHILGRPVQQRDYARSSRVVRRWAAGGRSGGGGRERAAVAAWHAAAMLRDAVPAAAATATATDTNLFHVPWCLYLATLTCWAFHHARPSRRDRGAGLPGGQQGAGEGARDDSPGEDSDASDASDEMVWDSSGEMEALVREMTGSGDPHTAAGDLLAGQGRKRTSGLVWVVADLLSKVRWGIVHGGVVVLRGLVPMRLINQYETT